MSCFSKILEESYNVLVSSYTSSLDESFRNESIQREKVNKRCLSFIESLSVNDRGLVFPEGYSAKSILSDILAGLLVSHNGNRVKILKMTRVLLLPAAVFSRLRHNIKSNIWERKTFIFLSNVFLMVFCVKRLLVNFATTFVQFKADYKNGINNYMLCVGFPWYSFVKHKSDDINGFSQSNNKYLGLANYLQASKAGEDTCIITIAEYDLKRWGSNESLHKKDLIPRVKSKKGIASPICFFNQLKNQFSNIKDAFSLISNLNSNSYADKPVLFLSIIRYFTNSPDMQLLIDSFSKQKLPVTLLYNANSFYSFPWYAKSIKSKHHYMYADNCCYFPFSYFSPSNISNGTPDLVNNDSLLYGYLEWPIYNRVIGFGDIGYQGISRLSSSIRRKNKLEEEVINPEDPLQLGSIKKFIHSEKSVYKKKNIKKTSILFLDGATFDIESQQPILDVPVTFFKPEVTRLYYDSLFELLVKHDISIYIRPKYRPSDYLVSAIDDFISNNPNARERLNIVSSRVSLHKLFCELEPSIVLVKPMSSTYLFSNVLGNKTHYYLPEKLCDIFDQMLREVGVNKTSERHRWMTEKKLLKTLSSN